MGLGEGLALSAIVVERVTDADVELLREVWEPYLNRTCERSRSGSGPKTTE